MNILNIVNKIGTKTCHFVSMRKNFSLTFEICMQRCTKSHYNIKCLDVNPKGQIILKCLFGVLNSSKKRSKNFCPRKLGQKVEFSSSFFGRIEDIKKTFRN